MESVKGTLPVLALAALLLAVPAVPAEEPEDAPALWTELYGDDGVVGLALGEGGVAEGEPIQGALTFQDGYGVEDVRYQICYIGKSCFASGMPLQGQGSTWSLDTSRISEDLGRPAKETYEGGERLGVQFFVCTTEDAPCPENPLEWRPFPVGEEGCADRESNEAFRECEETHYFGVTIQETKAIPSPAVPLILTAVAAAVVAARRR